jgi:phage-related protein
MENIIFIKYIWVNEFLESEGSDGVYLSSIIEGLQGAQFDALMKSKTLKKIDAKHGIYYLRKKYSSTFFRFLGPKVGNKIHLIHVFKKKSDTIPSNELRTTIERAKKLKI